jgi:aminoglycoside/choline kinase family phosphotransferase/GTP:adenosylcobinamide-phosphate guanylyltransferase
MMKALILAAGLGTRLLPYTRMRPKPLFPLAGRPLLERHILQLREAGCEAVIVNTHHLPEQIESFIASGRWGIPVVARREPDILGTGGAIRNVGNFWDERPFFVINADICHAVDLRRVYAFHLREAPAATLVLADDAEFNSVTVDPAGRIREFAPCPSAAPAGALTFTGIQVLDPSVLDHIPAEGASHSIEVFRAMIAGGRDVRGFIATQGEWMDLGTPERYRRAAREAAAREAWERAFSQPAPAVLTWERLEGDGSDRQWSRVKAAGCSLVLADHGLRATAAVAEVDAFIHIGRHLKSKGLPVPAIHWADPFAGLVFLEDLGDANLQSAVRGAPDRRQTMAVYRRVIDGAIALSVEGAEGFDPAWTYQTPAYDRQVVMERECRYFCDAFLRGYVDLDAGFDDLQDEFGRIAEQALADDLRGFMHRDLQSRNIMLRGDRFYFIDFQGGRLGPVQYDLASLLIDPYAGLAPQEQEHLLGYALQQLAARRPVDAAGFRRAFSGCALSRNLQVLGAFGFLTTVKGKSRFARYIPVALQGLAGRLAMLEEHFPKLQRVVLAAHEKLGIEP